MPAIRWKHDGIIVALFVALAFLSFGPAIAGPFDFDDRPAIAENATIRQLRPFTSLLHPPADSPVAGRPVVNVSFALNYALNRRLGIPQSPETEAPRQTVGFHVVNIAIHIATALLLFGIIRRTVQADNIRAEYRGRADLIAWLGSLVWLVHPVQTEAVDYVTQRTELLVSFFYATVLYASIRAWHSSAPRRWTVLAVAAGALGMASKEVMITAPVMVMLYDRAFFADSWRAAWRDKSRRSLYVALAIVTLLTALFVARGARDGTVGFDRGLAWSEYLYSQGWAVWHYITLIVRPVGLAFDYGRNPVHGLAGVPGSIGLLAITAAACWAWTRDDWRWAGFLGAWFFIILVPSSSVVPIRTEIAAERRVYLASAAVIVFAVVIARASIQWLANAASARGQHARRWILAGGAVVFVAALSALIVGTRARSALYDDLRERWRSAIVATPSNGRAYDNLASAELRATPPRVDVADSILHRAMIVDSAFTPALVRSSTIALAKGEYSSAVALLERALAIHPGDAMATGQLGTVYLAARRADLAIPYLQRYAEAVPNGASLTRLGLAYLMARKLDAAAQVLRRAATIDSTSVDARRYLAAVLLEEGKGADALATLLEATRLDPSSGELFAMLSLARAEAGQTPDAVQTADHAAALAPTNPAVLILAGRAMHTAGQYLDAELFLERAVRLSPDDPQALTRLAMAERALGKNAEAKQLIARALHASPGYPLAIRYQSGR